jgi:hypothetical protein
MNAVPIPVMISAGASVPKPESGVVKKPIHAVPAAFVANPPTNTHKTRIELGPE